MPPRHSLASDPGSILLAIAASLYFFALQPWAIVARTVLLVATFIFTRATRRHSVRHRVKMTSPPGLVESLESKVKRAITIESALNDRNLDKCHPQTQSPLYFRLPKELRDHVFELACTQSPDERHSYSPNSFAYRPSHIARLRTYTALLLTCRRIWLESSSLPMRQAEHPFWFQRGPYDRHPDSGWHANVHNERNRYIRFINSLTTRNMTEVAHIHLFLQMFQAQQLTLASRMADFFPHDAVQKGFKPKRLTVTIRSTDWWDWERGRALSLQATWMQSLLDSPFLAAVDELALELEAEEKRADQLESIVESIVGLQGNPKLCDLTGRDRGRACRLVCDGRPSTFHWSRSPRIGNREYDIYSDLEVLELRVATVVWKNKPCDVPDQPPQPAYPEGDRVRHERVRAPGFTVHGRSPSLIFRPRALRERLRSGGWIVGRFPEKEEEVRADSVRRAAQWQQSERERHEKMFADIAAHELMARWRAQDSLLTFADEA